VKTDRCRTHRAIVAQLAVALPVALGSAPARPAEDWLPPVVEIPYGRFIAGSDRRERELAYRLDERAYGEPITRRERWYEGERHATLAAPGRAIVKGGSWDDKGCGVCRPTARHARPVALKHILIGFRLVRQAHPRSRTAVRDQHLFDGARPTGRTSRPHLTPYSGTGFMVQTE
jgi:hypothetical protein